MMRTANRLHSIEEYYFSKKLREVRSLISQGKPIINMAIGSPDLLPSEEVINALHKATGEQNAHQYQSYQGIPELRDAMAQFYHSKFRVDLDSASEILPLMGSKEGIMHISMAFVNPLDEVLIPNPGYPSYAAVTKLVGGIPRAYQLRESNQWLPDIQDLEAQDLSKVKLMWINYPHMPTGATANGEMYRSLIDFAKKHQILLVNDNPYSFVLGSKTNSILEISGAKDAALELNSLSKTFNMAGWRVGMVVGSAGHIEAILKVKSNMDSGMFYGIQKGAVEALNSKEHWFKELNYTYESRRELIYKLADKLNCTYDTEASGMFVWAKLPNGSSTSEEYIDELLYEKDLFVAPGTIFGSNGEGYIRFSLCVKKEKIEEAISRVSTA